MASRRAHPEQDFQIALIGMLDVVLTKQTRCFAVPNGGWRSRGEAAIFKAMGVRPGVTDLVFIHAGRAYGLELKAFNGRHSAAQVQEQDRLRAAGMVIGEARTLDEAMDFLRANGIPLRIKDRC